MQTFAWTSTCLAFNAAKIRLQRGFNFSVWRQDLWGANDIPASMSSSSASKSKVRPPVPCCFVLLGSRCWLWCFHVHLAIQIYLVQELWRCFNEWLQHLRSKKISLKPSLSLNDPVVVHATCVPRNKERCQFCLTAWPKQLIHIAHTNMFVYKAYLWDTTCRLSSKRFWTDRVNFNISQNGFLLAAITRRAAWPPRISQARQWKLRAKLEGLHETKRRKAKSEIAIIQITNWVGTRDDTALVVSDVDVEVVEVILRKSYRFHCVPTWSTRQLEERISLGQRICGHHTERLNDWRPKNSVLTLWHLAPETSELPPLVHSRDEAFLDNFF